MLFQNTSALYTDISTIWYGMVSFAKLGLLDFVQRLTSRIKRKTCAKYFLHGGKNRAVAYYYFAELSMMIFVLLVFRYGCIYNVCYYPHGSVLVSCRANHASYKPYHHQRVS